jgi:hypothetical protein
MQFFGPGKGRLWCSTATETMHFWDWGGSIAQQVPDYMAVEEDPEAGADSCHMMDAREQLNNALKQDPGLFKGQVCSAARALSHVYTITCPRMLVHPIV